MPREPQADKEQEGKIKVGTAIIKHLSTSFYPNPNMIFDELMSNSRDAMATTVDLRITATEVTIEDDGDGMSHDELTRFFYISYSSKPQEPVKKKGRMVREIIGKFGIGKLSLYQLCKSFEIISWKDGVESQAVFDFEAFEKQTFIDDFTLKIISTRATGHKNGTKIILKELKQKVDAMKIKRHLIRTMPLAGDFKIRISGVGLSGTVEMRAEDVLPGNVFRKFKVDEFVEKVGPVTGNIYYKKTTEMKDFGVHVRIFGRLVNADDPHSIINFSSLTSAQQFDRRVYADLNANGLNEALQTNRAGFVVDHPAYVSFVEWLKKKLNRLNKEVGTTWKEERAEGELEVVKATLSRLSSKTNPSQTRSAITTPKSKKGKEQAASHKKSSAPEPEEEETDLFTIKGRSYSIDILPLGEDEAEAALDKKQGMIIVNSSHPLYSISRSQGGIWGVQYHAIRASIVLIALASSDSMEEFKKTYDKLTFDSQEIISNMKKRLTNMK